MLIEYGVPAERMSTEGRGETEPIADNSTPEGKHTNRRVEVELVEE
jgi:OOP family OmpA-OmpF porin